MSESRKLDRSGQLITSVLFGDVWIQASIRENSVGNIKPGDRVELALVPPVQYLSV